MQIFTDGISEEVVRRVNQRSSGGVGRGGRAHFDRPPPPPHVGWMSAHSMNGRPRRSNLLAVERTNKLTQTGSCSLNGCGQQITENGVVRVSARRVPFAREDSQIAIIRVTPSRDGRTGGGGQTGGRSTSLVRLQTRGCCHLYDASVHHTRLARNPTLWYVTQELAVKSAARSRSTKDYSPSYSCDDEYLYTERVRDIDCSQINKRRSSRTVTFFTTNSGNWEMIILSGCLQEYSTSIKMEFNLNAMINKLV